MHNKATGARKGFRVQIPTLANSQFADKAWFENIEPNKQNFSKQVVNGCGSKSFSRLLEKYAMSVPQSQLEELKSVLHHVYGRRFKGKCKTPKYGSINKGFTELELQHFLRNVPNEKFRFLFRYQAYLGLRVEEVSKLHISNINFDKRELIIKSEKSAVSDSLVIPSDLFNETIDFINKNIASIKASSGYIFFKENDNNSNKVLYIDMNYVRKVFRQIAKATELNQVYDYSEETSAP
jgi:integrase